MTKLGLFTSQALEAHRPPGEHAERPERLHAVRERLATVCDAPRWDWFEPKPVERSALERVHTPAYVRSVLAACEAGPGWFDSDTYQAGPASLRAADLATGAVLEATDRVMAGELQRAFCAVRPPGHHAEADRAMGFCLWNSIAAAASHLREHHGLKRVFVLDWDVHHGNGTQAIFDQDPNVFFASLHQAPCYPGSGAAHEQGTGPGVGATLNLPQTPGSGPAEWLDAIERHVLPNLEAFDPDFVLVSAGFDAHRADPLAQVNIETETFEHFTRLVTEAADTLCAGRIVSVLEGGYDLSALADSVEAHVRAL